MPKPTPQNPREISALLQIMADLRDPDEGCPWDVAQDYRSIASYTLEEAYEVVDAIERGNRDELREELGDLLLQVVFHAQMASEEGRFTFADVVEGICGKMIRRHPHVFVAADGRDVKQQTVEWEKIKQQEKLEQGGDDNGLLDDVPLHFPGLTRAVKLQKRAARVGFDWPQIEQVIDKLCEEVEELNEARNQMSQDKIEEEFGDLLFVMANLARHLKIDPETALRRANEKFCTRFAHIESRVSQSDRDWPEFSLDDLEAYWQEAKMI
jgi:nucleoside triphosphate diphosphatase